MCKDKPCPVGSIFCFLVAEELVSSVGSALGTDAETYVVGMVSWYVGTRFDCTSPVTAINVARFFFFGFRTFNCAVLSVEASATFSGFGSGTVSLISYQGGSDGGEEGVTQK